MLLTKEVEIKVHPTNIEYLKNLGYEIPMRPASETVRKAHHKDFVYDVGATISVKVDDLLPNSNADVDVLCDYCGEEITSTKYYLYTKAMNNFPKYACKKCVHLKIEEVNMNKYGVTCVLKDKEFRNKGKETMLIKYGTCNQWEVPEIKDKWINTCIERYGVAFYSQSDEFKEKYIETCQKNRGTDYPSQSKEVREKVIQSFYKNSSQKSSSQQRYICELFSGVLNYPIKYYNTDIYLSKNNIVIEYDGGGHMLNVLTGRETKEEFDQKEIIRNNVIKREGYKQMRIISTKDLLPSDSILLQMLEHAKQYFSDYPFHSWIEFDIDTSTVRSAEQKDGVYYDYGKLRRIKKSDVENINECVESA